MADLQIKVSDLPLATVEEMPAARVPGIADGDSKAILGETFAEYAGRALPGLLTADEELAAAVRDGLDLTFGESVHPTYRSPADAAGRQIYADVKTLRVEFRAPSYALPATLVGGAIYARISKADIDAAGYPAASYFRSTDRFMPDGTVSSTNGGYWVIAIQPYNLFMFGAKGDGVTDDTAAINAASTLVGLRNGGQIDCTGGRWLIDSGNVVVKKNVQLIGPHLNFGEELGQDYTAIPSAFIVNPTYGVNLAEDHSGVKGMAFVKKGVTKPTNIRQALDLIASFAGKAVTVGTDSTTLNTANDTYVGYCSFFGFEYGYYNNFNERPVVEYVKGDCTYGIYMKRIYDVEQVNNCEFWPFLTTHQSWTFTTYAVSGAANNGSGLIRLTVATHALKTGDIISVKGVLGTTEANGRWTVTVIDSTTLDLQESTFTNAYTSGGTVVVNAAARRGKAFWFDFAVDWAQAANCFAYGYDEAFYVNGSDHCEFVNCGSDNYGPAQDPDPIGFHIVNSISTKLIAPKVAAQGRGIVADVGSTNTLIITGWDAWGGVDSYIHVVSGGAIITSGTMKNGATAAARGIVIEPGADACTVVGNSSKGISTPISVTGAALRKLTCWGNSWPDPTSVGNRISVSNSQRVVSLVEVSDTNTGSSISGQKARGSQDTPAVANNGDELFTVRGQAWEGSAFSTSAAISFGTRAAASPGSTPGAITFWTTPSGSAAPVSRFMLNEGGSFYPLTDNAVSIGVSGNRLSAVWSANGTIQTSDEREKTDIETASLGLDFINALRPVSYKWISGGKEVIRQVYRDAEGNECTPDADGAIASEIITEDKPGARTHWGLIAQEVKSVCDAAGVDFGGWVLSDSEDPDSQQALRYDQFISPLIKAVQELAAKVEAIEQRPA